jgi:hypothetical protein
MATDTDAGVGSLGERAPHLRSILVTGLASLAGVVAGVVSDVVAAGPTDTLALAMCFGFAFASLGAMRIVGVDVGEFGVKDNVYVFFMTFAFWFVTWGILLTSA